MSSETQRASGLPFFRRITLNIGTNKTLNQGLLESAWATQGPMRSCLSCDHFKEKAGELCGLVNQRPPARVIAFGCTSYNDDNQIPF